MDQRVRQTDRQLEALEKNTRLSFNQSFIFPASLLNVLPYSEPILSEEPHSLITRPYLVLWIQDVQRSRQPMTAVLLCLSFGELWRGDWTGGCVHRGERAGGEALN